MSRRFLALVAFAVLSPGCVPVTEPVGDIDRAEPNKDLIGTWQDDEMEPRQWIVDRPEVKGNPKGLMRVRLLEKGKRIEDLKARDALWFFTATIGKQTYANIFAHSGKPGEAALEPDLGKEGAYAEWAKSDKRGYYVAHLAIKGPVVTTDPGDHRAFEALMTKEKFTEIGPFYKTSPGWLTKYLEKNGPEGIFDAGKGKNTLTRVNGKK